MRSGLVVRPGAQRGLDRLPPNVQHAVAALITGPRLDNPQRVGKPLGGEFSGYWSARRADYRVIYEIAGDVVTVTVVRIGPRSAVHRT